MSISLLEVFILAVALSIDAMVMSFSQGLVFTVNKRKNSLILASSVGFFQFFMPIVGYFLAQNIYKYVHTFDRWIVFAIFMFLGIKFIKEAFDEKDCCEVKCLSVGCICFISFATSIDALGAGISLCFSKSEIFLPAVIIGIITFINSLIGFWGGYLFKHFPSKNLEILAGTILITLAIKSLLF